MGKIDHEERASRAWPVLAKLAAQRKLTTYGKLGKAIGVHHRAVQYLLDPIQRHCEENDIPPLTILVHNKDTKKPGRGFYQWNLNREDEVFRFDWGGKDNPFT